MENKIVFRRQLSQLKELAVLQKNRITEKEIREAFADAPLEEEHFQLIYDYLRGQGIRIADEREEQEEKEEEKPEILSLYLEELEKMGAFLPEEKNTLSREEELELFHSAFAGGREARNRLTERYLSSVCEIAKEYEGDEVAMEDLIQEGNIGLLMAFEQKKETSEDEFETLAGCQAYLLNRINEFMKEAMKKGKQEKESGEQIAGRANHLNEAVKNLQEDLEHKVSLEEISAYLEMPLEEVKDIMRMTGDEIEHS